MRNFIIKAPQLTWLRASFNAVAWPTQPMYRGMPEHTHVNVGQRLACKQQLTYQRALVVTRHLRKLIRLHSQELATDHSERDLWNLILVLPKIFIKRPLAIHTYIHTYIHTHIHTYTYTYTYTYIHTYTYIYQASKLTLLLTTHNVVPCVAFMNLICELITFVTSNSWHLN